MRSWRPLVIVSAIFVGTSAEVVQRTGDVVDMSVKSLLTLEGIRWMLLSAVDNFIEFAPLGPVLTVMIGIGVAERTGFISMGLKVLVTKVPASLLTATVVFAGVMSSMAADAGYVVLTPLGALLLRVSAGTQWRVLPPHTPGSRVGSVLIC